MGISYIYLKRRDLLFIQLAGHIRQPDIFHFISRTEHKKNLKLPRFELIEFTRQTDFDLSYDEMRAVRRHELSYYTTAPNRVQTVICAPEDTGFGMARMYQQMVATTDDHQVEITRTEAEALALLKQPETTFEQLRSGARFVPT